MRPSAYLTFISILVLFVMIGCSEEDSTCPTCPGPPSPSMDNLWPNEDGNSWTYEQMIRRWEADPWTLYETPGEVPDAPTLDYVEALLGDPGTGADPDTMSYIFRLEFDGICVSDSGATGQCLVETLFDEWDDDITMLSFDQALLGRLRISRPDLGDELRKINGPGMAAADIEAVRIRNSLMLHGGIWEKTEDHIGMYGDIDTLLAWQYLEPDISTGHEFTFQLLPSLPGQVYMHCRVLSRGSVRTEYGTYKNAVRCLYLIDYGIAEMQPPTGTRYFRTYDYGTITYAPGVGPISSYERMLIDTTVPDGPGYGDVFMELIGSGGD